MTRVLAISAHPDDETLGAGGTLLRHAARGDEINWIVVTEPHSKWFSQDFRAAAESQVRAAAKAYSCKYQRLGFPTARLDLIAQVDLMQKIGDAIAKIRPEIVYLVHEGDVHSDHAAVFSAAMSVLKPFHMAKYGVKRILSFETLSSTEAAPASSGSAFLPNTFVDITDLMDRKIAIMSIFETEKQGDFMPRGASAIRALGRYRGATIGVEYAEAFMLIREVRQDAGWLK